MRSSVTAVILIVTFVASNCASAQNPCQPTGRYIRTGQDLFGSDLEIRATDGRLEYCPDNTCEAFFTSNSATKENVAEFAVLYLLFVSDYGYLTEIRRGAAAKRAADQIVKVGRRTGCDVDSDDAVVKCRLRALFARGIGAVFVRYDEGQRIEIPIDLEQMLSRLRPTRPQEPLPLANTRLDPSAAGPPKLIRMIVCGRLGSAACR